MSHRQAFAHQGLVHLAPPMWSRMRIGYKFTFPELRASSPLLPSLPHGAQPPSGGPRAGGPRDDTYRASTPSFLSPHVPDSHDIIAKRSGW